MLRDDPLVLLILFPRFSSRSVDLLRSEFAIWSEMGLARVTFSWGKEVRKMDRFDRLWPFEVFPLLILVDAYDPVSWPVLW